MNAPVRYEGQAKVPGANGSIKGSNGDNDGGAATSDAPSS